MLPERFKEFEKFLSSAGVDPNVQVEELAWALVPGGLPDGPAAANNTAVPTSEQVVGVALGFVPPRLHGSLLPSQETAGGEGSQLFSVRV